jgi:enterochelin esterase-like enzyme
MRKREIPHEFRIHDGGHTWTYWRKALPTVLAFNQMPSISIEYRPEWHRSG